MTFIPTPPAPPIIRSINFSEYNPIDLWDIVASPPFPAKGILPKVVEDYAIVMCGHMGASGIGIAMSALTVIGALIPDQLKIQVKKHDPKWLESARLWTILIGEPSTKKTPIISAAVRPIVQMDSALVRDWQLKHRNWASLTKEEREHISEPLQRRLRIEDTTIEAAQEVLRGSPDGVLCIQDELSGWFGMMERYGSTKSSAADRAFWLKAYNGGSFALNRVGRGTVLLDNLSISLLGGIQPEAIRKVAADSVDDGLLQRMIPVSLHIGSVGMDRPIPDVQGTYDFTLMLLPYIKIPVGPLRFDEDGQILRQRAADHYFELMSTEIVSRKFASHVGKLDGLFGRLCVIWHVLENIGQPIIPNIVKFETAERVEKFIRQYVIPSIACFYSQLGYSDDHDRLKAIAGHILAHNLTEVTVRDVQRGTRAMRKISAPEVLPLLQQLVALNWLIATDGPRASSDPKFIVNPIVHQLYAKRGEEEKQRREKAREVMQQYFTKRPYGY